MPDEVLDREDLASSLSKTSCLVMRVVNGRQPYLEFVLGGIASTARMREALAQASSVNLLIPIARRKQWKLAAYMLRNRPLASAKMHRQGFKEMNRCFMVGYLVTLEDQLCDR